LHGRTATAVPALFVRNPAAVGCPRISSAFSDAGIRPDAMSQGMRNVRIVGFMIESMDATGCDSRQRKDSPQDAIEALLNYRIPRVSVNP